MHFVAYNMLFIDFFFSEGKDVSVISPLFLSIRIREQLSL